MAQVAEPLKDGCNQKFAENTLNHYLIDNITTISSYVIISIHLFVSMPLVPLIWWCSNFYGQGVYKWVVYNTFELLCWKKGIFCGLTTFCENITKSGHSLNSKKWCKWCLKYIRGTFSKIYIIHSNRIVVFVTASNQQITFLNPRLAEEIVVPSWFKLLWAGKP